MDDITPRTSAPEGWLEALNRSDAQLAAGQVVSGAVVMAKLRATIDRLEAKQAGTAQAKVAARR